MHIQHTPTLMNCIYLVLPAVNYTVINIKTSIAVKTQLQLHILRTLAHKLSLGNRKVLSFTLNRYIFIDLSSSGRAFQRGGLQKPNAPLPAPCLILGTTRKPFSADPRDLIGLYLTSRCEIHLEAEPCSALKTKRFLK